MPEATTSSDASSSRPDLQAYTETVIAAIGAKASPRVKKVFPILLRKLHEFIIEADITVEEWLGACDLLIEAGKVSSEQRNEMVLVTDVLGVESLVDTLAYLRTSAAPDPSHTSDPSHSAILGPFYRKGVPTQANGTSIIRQDEGDADYTRLFGKVMDQDGTPIKGAIVDVWHDAPDGLYDSQSPEKPEYHCRGRFETDAEGRYECICLRPTPYPIPFDFSAGKLLTMMDRHPYRPAHIHFYVEAEGRTTLVSQIFDRKSDYLTDDSVFAVKDQLIVDFKPISESDSGYEPPKEYQGKIKYEIEHNIVLSKATHPDAIAIEGLAIGGEPAMNGK